MKRGGSGLDGSDPPSLACHKVSISGGMCFAAVTNIPDVVSMLLALTVSVSTGAFRSHLERLAGLATTSVSGFGASIVVEDGWSGTWVIAECSSLSSVFAAGDDCPRCSFYTASLRSSNVRSGFFLKDCIMDRNPNQSFSCSVGSVTLGPSLLPSASP